MKTDHFRLKELSIQLQVLTKSAQEQYEQRTTATDYEVDFFGEAKPFADQLQNLADEWKPIATEWAIKERPKYVYPIQIKDTYENLTIIAVQAFQSDTKSKRFQALIKSIDYILESIIMQVPKESKE